MKKALAAVAVVVTVAAAAVIAVVLLRGPAEPAISIEAYYPFKREGFFIADYLEALAQQHPGTIKFTYACYGDDDGYEKWRRTGLECGGVFINGRNKFQVVVEGKSQEVLFIKRMGVYWTKEQFEAALGQVMREVD